MNQTDFSEVAGCSASTVQAIELGKLKLSESLAAKIEFATGVSRQWLIANDRTIAPVHRYGGPYTYERYEVQQAYKQLSKTIANFYIDIPGLAFGSYVIIRDTLALAAKSGDRELALYRLSRLLEEFVEATTGQPFTHKHQYSKETIKTIEADLNHVRILVEQDQAKDPAIDPSARMKLGFYWQSENKKGEPEEKTG